MSEMHVACVVQGDYLPHCAAMLHSVLSHQSARGVHVHFLHGPDLAERPVDELGSWLRDAGADLTVHRVDDERCAGLPTVGFTGKATWYRIFLPDLLGETDRVLFLDADLIVCDDLAPLWTTDLSGAYLGAVTNVCEPEYLGRPAELGLAGPGEYFNAGVLLMDLDAMRRDQCARRLYEFGVEHADELVWRDQDALNVVLAGRRKRLHPRWNVMNILWFRGWSDAVFGAEAVDEALRSPGIRHFEGPADNKPWHWACARDRRELYFEHRKGTPWPRARLEGARAPRLRRTTKRMLRRLASGARRVGVRP
jgi:lipopolysaccharide biosynthesis glycosyltransferase